MYLKSMEVQGFKSFANKIVLKFKPGITGIVGPNGSGKSNVSDAVRWVLGEQKVKSLRGSSMQDVIFSGTEMRKPLSYAYVAITLDNSDHALAIDYDEVTVSRRLYRSGESEYRINSNPVRLKDVYELFYDTGIGKEGYSIIGQGQIDRILSGKPEERRELFDEAAGIVKFKRRKVETIKKLESERQNLVRLNDILSELTRNLGPLEKQSEKAHIYLKKKEEQKTLDVNVFLMDHERVSKQLEGVNEKYRITSDNLTETRESYDQIRQEYEQVQEQIDQLNAEIEQAHQTLTDSSVNREKLEGQIRVYEERIHSVENNKEHLENRKKAIQEQIDERNAEKDEILKAKKATDDELAEIERSRDRAGEALQKLQDDIEELNRKIESDKNRIIDALNARATTKSQLGRLGTMEEQVLQRKAELSSRMIRMKSEEAEQDQLIESLAGELADLGEQINAENAKQAETDLRLGEIKEQLRAKDEELQKVKEKYHQEKSRLETLRGLSERYDGYNNAVRMVMDQKNKNKGIIGVVADIFQVEKKYETAIEIALGGNIQNIVTEDDKAAKDMIEFLKKNRHGRATFLPLTSLEHPQEFKDPGILAEDGVLGLADTLITMDRKYRNVAKTLLGRIVVVDTVDRAVKLAKKYQYSVRMVTLEGELLAPGGAISGGAFKNGSNLLSKRREVEELEGEVAKLQDQISEIDNAIAAIREERNGLRVKADSGRMMLQNMSLKQNTLQLNLEAAKAKKDESENGFGSLQDEEAEIAKQMKEIEDGKAAVNAELENSESAEAETKLQIEELQKQVDALHEQESAQAEETAKWNLEVQKIRQKQGFDQENIDRIDGEIARHTAELDEVLNSMSSNAEEVEQKREDIEALRETIQASFNAQTEAEELLKESNERKENLTKNQKKFFDTREELSEKIIALEGEVGRLQTQKERQEDYIESQINYMWDEYEITLSDAAKMRDPNMDDLSDMKKRIATLKDEIRKLGDVNVNAIEEYKTQFTRYTFMKTQHDDLVEAEKQLVKAIDDLDASMRKQFSEKFASISKEFDKVFKELFGGGKGTLELMEDEDILEAGINITAQPPGKKLQNMNMLSGGEKALTAIALLFAIQNLKPSPFCLLDEIEAALDENNVSRFAKYLHKLTKSTQFIVITHRRGTMESADRLYGITMQEKGVSTLVSVDLIDKELTN